MNSGKKKMQKKPKESASPPSGSFNMHFSLRGMAREGDLEEENGGGDQFEWRQIRGAPELLSLNSNQRGMGLP